MRSIRRSLIVYFLMLMTAALGAVAWLSYETTAESLRERQSNSRKLIEAQCDANCKAARDDLDRRLLQQARVLARMSKSTFIHAEGQFALLGILGANGLPGGRLNAMTFGMQAWYKEMPYLVFANQPLSTHIDWPIWGPEDDGERPTDYFQSYRGNGYAMQRSDSLAEGAFTLDRKLRRPSAWPNEYFDDVVLPDGARVRRVTLKNYISGYGFKIVAVPWKGPQPPYFKMARPAPAKGGGGKGGRPPFQKGPQRIWTHFFYLQYASDLAPTDAKISAFQSQRNHQIAELATAIDRDLYELRTNMLWTGVAALLALWLGGYGVIRLGLAPLSKMSEAVASVSPRDFHLPLDAGKLPVELQPIAGTLVTTLEHLQKAFEREKQAAADISHELRTPLAALMTTLEVGLKKQRSPEEYRELLQECQLSGQTMYQLVERLLTLARLDAGVDQYRPTDVDVTDLALHCADVIRPLARAKDITLKLNLPEPITTKTDPNKLREILTNLLHNAVEYNKPRGSIHLSVERVKGHVRFEVRDTGIGIKPDMLDRVFERFYRADASRHSDSPHAGLGLSIVKSYVDLIEGTIRVESDAAGTTFFVELPYSAVQPDLKSAVTAKPELVRS